jgi:hypothetical protein
MGTLLDHDLITRIEAHMRNTHERLCVIEAQCAGCRAKGKWVGGLLQLVTSGVLIYLLTKRIP